MVLFLYYTFIAILASYLSNSPNFLNSYYVNVGSAMVYIDTTDKASIKKLM